jgi:predicted permease
MFERWLMDVRYSARRLAGRRAYAGIAVLTLALGAGGTAAIFSIVRAVLLERLPIAEEQRVGVFWHTFDWTEQEFLYLRPSFPGFSRVAAYHPQDFTLQMAGQPLQLVKGITASAELFDVLGMAPLLGRSFHGGDDLSGGQRVAVLSYGLWRDLGSDRTLVGRMLELGGRPHLVVGVMPRGFWFPSPETRVWTTNLLSPERRSGMYALIGRTSGADITQMDETMRGLARRLGERFQYPRQWDKTLAPAVTPVREYLLGDLRPSLTAAFGAMTLILLIACVNVAALMLGQLGARTTELAVRSALGAGRQRLVQMLLVESVAIGAIAGAAGALVASIGFDVLGRALPLGALAERATLSWTVFWAAMGVSIGASLIVALVPALAMWRTDLRGRLAAARTDGIGTRGRLEAALVIGQMALAVLLAGSAGLMIRSVSNLRAIDPGLTAEGVVVADATMPSQLSTDRRRVVLDAIPVLQALPGVRAVGATMKLPLRGSGQNWGITIPGKPELSRTTTAFRIVSVDYFSTLGIRVTRGRGFTTADRGNTAPVVIINEALASKYFPGEEPLGRVIQTGFDDRVAHIVGVVGNVAEATLAEPAVPARYMLYDQAPPIWQDVTFVVAAAHRDDVPRLLDLARTTIQEATNHLAVQRVTTMASVLDLAIGAPLRVATLLTLLAALAMVLGAIGIYGVMSHFVHRRTRDYGICIALGLAPERVVAHIVRRGWALAAAGSALGLAATVAAGERLSTLLYGVRPMDPVVLLAAVLALLMTATLASFMPAWRASRTDASVVLRQQ